jgi:hypothetical protein
MADRRSAFIGKNMGPTSGRALRVTPEKTIEFWLHVSRAGALECWEWTGALTRGGYGQMSLNKRPVGAHRVAYAITYGEVPPRLCVMHSCDNPPCVNPAHLSLGTHRENILDARAKGRLFTAHGPRLICGCGALRDLSLATVSCRNCHNTRREFLQNLSHAQSVRRRLHATLRVIPPSTFKELLEAVQSRRAEAFARHFGLYDRPAVSYAEIAADLGVGDERVRQLVESAQSILLNSTSVVSSQLCLG